MKASSKQTNKLSLLKYKVRPDHGAVWPWPFLRITAGRIWYAADFAGFPTYETRRVLWFLSEVHFSCGRGYLKVTLYDFKVIRVHFISWSFCLQLQRSDTGDEMQTNNLKTIQRFSGFVLIPSQSWSVPLISVTDLYMLLKWENRIRYVFAPVYIVHLDSEDLTTHQVWLVFGSAHTEITTCDTHTHRWISLSLRSGWEQPHQDLGPDQHSSTQGDCTGGR